MFKSLINLSMANNMKLYAFLSHVAKCRDLRVKVLCDGQKLGGGGDV